MTLPCEYCGAPVEADQFVKLGVWPCCHDCQWMPALLGIGGVLVLGVVIFLVVKELYGF